MRRKSERTAGKKGKASPEKKVEKVKRTRTRRRKQSTSSENESAEEANVVQEQEEVQVHAEVPINEAPTTPAKEASPQDDEEQVWHVKAADSSGDGGEIQKLKICLTRPPSTPERTERSPRSKRKHSRATSSSDTQSGEPAEEKRKTRHRSRRITHESKEESDKTQDSQEEESEIRADVPLDDEKVEVQVTQSNEARSAPVSDETPMSTTTDEVKGNDEKTTQNKEESKNDGQMNEGEKQKSSDADTTVTSPKADESQSEGDVSSGKNCQVDTSTDRQAENSPEHERGRSVEKADILELHADTLEESKSENNLEENVKKKTLTTPDVTVKEKKKKKKHLEERKQQAKGEDRASSIEKVSINEDKNVLTTIDKRESISIVKTTNKNNVVENSKHDEKKRVRKSSHDSENENKTEEINESYSSKDFARSQSIQSVEEEPLQNGQAPTPITPLVINRKRKWGSRPKVTTQKSITISTDILKEIIPDVKPVEFEEVIEEKKHKRIEITDKIVRPVLPKIVIDNFENVMKNEQDPDTKQHKTREPLSMNRRISIVKDNDSIIARPPSPPRYKPSNILFISNLVRPFTLPQLKNLLQRTGRIVENGFWIDRIKSKCYVQYENEDQAVETRHALHGVTWPVSNPKTLQVDFSTLEAFDKAKLNEDSDNAQASTIPGTVEDWLREQDQKREKGELEKTWERKQAMREWDVGKGDKDKEKDRLRKDDRLLDKRRHRSLERSPEPSRKFKKKEDEAPAKLLDDLFRKTKATPCIYWLPLSAETIAIKEEQRRKHMAEHERRMQELRRTQHRRH